MLLNIVLFFQFNFAQSSDVQTESYNRSKVVLNVYEQPLYSVLKEIKEQTGINFIYQDEIVNDINVSGKIKNEPLEKAIAHILDKTDISYKKFGENYIVLFKEKKSKTNLYKAEVVENNIPDIDTTFTLIKPLMLNDTKPVYPLSAAYNKIEGSVAVKLLVTKDGDVSKVMVEASSGSEILDSAAIDYVKKLKFMPAIINEKPSQVWLNMKFKYSVDD